jgi:hypothetical protein
MAMVDDFVDFIFLVFAAVFALLFIYMALNAVTSQSHTVTAQLTEETQLKRDLIYSLQPQLTTAILNNNKEVFYQESETFFSQVKNHQVPNDDDLTADPLVFLSLDKEDQERFIQRGTFDDFEIRYPESSSPITNNCYRPGKDDSYSSVELQTLHGESRFIYYCINRKNRKTNTEKVVQGLPGVSDE